MALISAILRNGTGGRLTWWCPGCDSCHQVPVTIASQALPTPDPVDPDWTPPAEYYEARGGWSWNGSAKRPTFMPSVLVTYPGRDADQPGGLPSVCHSFVVDGQMQFLSDCTHALAGKTVPIPAWPIPDWSDG